MNKNIIYDILWPIDVKMYLIIFNIFLNIGTDKSDFPYAKQGHDILH